MKACVSTFCTWNSYGSMLQTLGLRKALASLGWDSFVVKDYPEASYYPRLPKTAKQMLTFPFDCLHIKSRREVFRKGSKFIRDNIEMRLYPDYPRVCAEPPVADAYIAGSDQVWQPNKMKPLFFLDFVKHVKKISYAASMGKTEFPPEAREPFKKYLEDFRFLSVRERECAEVIDELTGRTASVNIDPTFFFDKRRVADL